MRLALCFALLLGACSPDTGGRPARDGGGGGIDAPGFDSGPRPDTNIDVPGSECVADTFMAESALQPVDIVWIIDTSGSMGEESSLVQEQMNSFVSTITGAGLDVHVVLIAAPGEVVVPAPLGTDPTQFLHIPAVVSSNDSLDVLLANFAEVDAFLRRTAALHFIVVTDDESEPDDDPNASASNFIATMSAMVARTFRWHSICSPPGSSGDCFFPGMECGCSGPRGDAPANGDVYWAISSMTGGRQLSICTPDWTPLFGELTTAIAIPMALPCVYDLPPPPPGEELDPGFVNIRYTPGGGTEETIPNVGDFSRCTGEGWYYEGDPADPDRILLCPNTCRRLELDAAGRVDLAVGCATVLI